MTDDANGWEASAAAWIADMGDTGDYSRQHILDAPMLDRARLSGARTALDVGCGEGRFCRMLRAEGVEAAGIDPTPGLLAQARARDPQGRYELAKAEALPFADASFGLVVSYLTLIDIADIDSAIAEMARVLTPGGRLLVANLNPFTTAGGWVEDAQGNRQMQVRDYLSTRADRVGWRGIQIVNWHRPMHRYMQAFLAQGLRLVHFDEPAPHGGDPDRARRYRDCPYFHLMEWVRD